MTTGRVPRRQRAGGVARRQCAVCRRPREALALLQLGHPEPGRRRRAYVCIEVACLQGAHARALGRALRGPVDALAGDGSLAALRALAQARLLALVGLARRCGVLVAGVDPVRALCAGAAADAPDAAVLLTATDQAPASRARLPVGWALPQVAASATLGAAAGRAALGALAIRPSRLAMQAAYWLRVWYATQHRPGTV